MSREAWREAQGCGFTAREVLLLPPEPEDDHRRWNRTKAGLQRTVSAKRCVATHGRAPGPGEFFCAGCGRLLPVGQRVPPEASGKKRHRCWECRAEQVRAAKARYIARHGSASVRTDDDLRVYPRLPPEVLSAREARRHGPYDRRGYREFKAAWGEAVLAWQRARAVLRQRRRGGEHPRTS